MANRDFSDLALCVLISCNTEDVLAQSISASIVRNVDPNFDDLGQVLTDRLQFIDDRGYANSISQTANIFHPPHDDDNWESNKALIYSTFTAPYILSAVYLSELFYATENEWRQNRNRNVADEFVITLLRLAIQSRLEDEAVPMRIRYDLQRLIELVPQPPVTAEVAEKLRQIHASRHRIIPNDPHQFIEGEKEQFTMNYTQSVTFCVREFNCYPHTAEVQN